MYIDLGSYQRALRAFKKTLILEPNNTRARNIFCRFQKRLVSEMKIKRAGIRGLKILDLRGDIGFGFLYSGTFDPG